MADLTDVQNALKGVITPVCYPNGTGNASIIGTAIQVGNGWPLPSTLDGLLASNEAVVSVFPHALERVTTRYLRQWQAQAPSPASLTLTVSGQVVTVGGAVPGTFVAHNLVVQVQGVAYGYALQPGDSLGSVATGLAAAIAVGVPGTVSSGPLIVLPGSANITGVAVGTGGPALLELRRQEKRFQVSVWCNSPTTRDAIATPVDAALAAVNFLSLADGTMAWLRYQGCVVDDGLQKARLYRRDLFYGVEYATVQSVMAPQVVGVGVGF